MSTSGEAIRLEVGRILNERLDPETMMQLVNTASSAAQITAAVSLASTAFSPQKFQDRILRETDSTGSAPDGEKSRARVLTPSTGVLTNSPSWTAALASTDTLEMWKDVDPDAVDRARDRALAYDCTRYRLVPLSMALDADFLVDALADATPTHWTGSSATAT